MKDNVLNLKNEMTHQNTRESYDDLFNLTMRNGVLKQMDYYVYEARKELKDTSPTWFVAQPSFINSMKNIFFIADSVRALCKRAFSTVEEFGGPYALTLQARKSVVITSDKERNQVANRNRKRDEKADSKSMGQPRTRRTQA